MVWNSNSESQRQNLSPDRFGWRWPSNGTLRLFSPPLQKSRASAGWDACKAIRWCTGPSITLRNIYALCPDRPVPLTGGKHSCDTSKIAQLSRSSIAALNARFANISRAMGLCPQGIATPPPDSHSVTFRIELFACSWAQLPRQHIRSGTPSQSNRCAHLTHEANDDSRHQRHPSHPPAPLSVSSRRRRRRNGTLEAHRRNQERHHQRIFLPGTFSRQTHHARLSHHRIHGADRRPASAAGSKRPRKKTSLFRRH